jgi:RHS repeat-associated protein
MAGISSKALNFGGAENKSLFSHQLLDDDFGLNWYQFKYRNHDPQIGRFWQIDPLAESFRYNSTYAYAENKLGKGFDLEGLELAEFNKVLGYAGINTQDANRNVQATVNNAIQKAQPVLNATKDVATIAAGVTLLVASGGTAIPLLVGLAGSTAVVGGTMKLTFDITGHSDAAQQIPTTISGTAIYAANGLSEATGNGKLVSDNIKTVVEFGEGVVTLKVSGFDNNLEKVSNALSAMNLVLDAANPETAKAFQQLIGTTGTPTTNVQPASSDNTHMPQPVILPDMLPKR